MDGASQKYDEKLFSVIQYMFDSKIATYGLYALVLAAVAVGVWLLVSYLMKDSYADADQEEEFLGFLDDDDEIEEVDDEEDYDDDDEEDDE